MQRVKMSKKKNEQDVKWKHSTEAVEKGKVSYICKFLGSTPVSHSKGSDLIKESIKKLQFANDIKKSEEGLKASKLKKVEFSLSVQNLILTDIKSKTTLYSFPLQRISYCADDKSSKRLFGFIAREKEKPQHHCYVLESDKNAEELTLAVGQAFDLAYKKFKASQAGTEKKQVDQMKQRVESTEKENEMLKKKLEEMERFAGSTTNDTKANEEPAMANHEFHQPATNSGQAAFDPFSFDANESAVPPVVDQHPETFAAPVNTNPFAVFQQEQPTSEATSNQADLLNMFSASSNQPVSSGAEDPFDPLSNNMTTPAQDTPQPPAASFSSFDQVASQPNDVAVPISRPKPPALAAGFLPPPPTKQSMKAAQKQKGQNTPDNSKPADPFAALNPMSDPSLSSNSHQGMQEVQEGMENNLVLF